MYRALGYLFDTAHLITTRILAYAIDCVLLLFFLSVAWMAFSSVTSWSVPFIPFQALGLVICFALIESHHDGQTPGKFLLRLRVIDAQSREAPTFYASLLRNAVLFIGPPLIYFVGDYVDFVLNLRFMGNISWMLLGVLIIVLQAYPALRSGGKVGLHDLVAGTVLLHSSSSSLFDASKTKREVMYVVFALLALYSGLIALTKVFHRDIEHDVKISGLPIFLKQQEDQYLRLEPEMRHVLLGIDDPKSFLIDGVLHFTGFYPLGQIEQNFNFSRPGFKFAKDSPEAVLVIQVHITLKGLISSRFQEQLAQNFMRIASSQAGLQYAVIEFIYQGDVLKIAYPLVKRRVLVVAGSSGFRSFPYVLSAGENLVVGVSDSPLPSDIFSREIQDELRRGKSREP